MGITWYTYYGRYMEVVMKVNVPVKGIDVFVLAPSSRSSDRYSTDQKPVGGRLLQTPNPINQEKSYRYEE
jgi:hypothetical protein